MRSCVYAGQWWAIALIPVWFLMCTFLIGFGVLVAALAIVAVPLAGLLAVPPLVGRRRGGMTTPEQITTGYATCTWLLWLSALLLGLVPAVLMHAPTSFFMLTPCIAFLGVIAWFGQIVTAALGASRTTVSP